MSKQRKHKPTAVEMAVDDFFEWPMLWVTLLLVPVIAVPYFLDLLPGVEMGFRVASVLIWILFYVEIFVKFLVSSSYLATAKRNWFLILILLSPTLLAFRFLRLARLLSLLRIFHLQSIVKRLRKGLRTLIYSLEYILLTLVIFTFVSSFLIWQIEQQAGGNITNYADALWWAVITITTIGYGDIVPGSTEGRIFGAVVSLIGIILFTVLVARITAFFMKDAQVEALKQALASQRKQLNEK